MNAGKWYGVRIYSRTRRDELAWPDMPAVPRAGEGIEVKGIACVVHCVEWEIAWCESANTYQCHAVVYVDEL